MNATREEDFSIVQTRFFMLSHNKSFVDNVSKQKCRTMSAIFLDTKRDLQREAPAMPVVIGP